MVKLHSRQRELTPLHIAATTTVTGGKGRMEGCVSCSCRPYVVMRTWSTSFCSWTLIQILQACHGTAHLFGAAELMSADGSPPGVYNYRAFRSQLGGSSTAPVMPLDSEVAHRFLFQPCDCAAPVTWIAELLHLVAVPCRSVGTRLDAAASPVALTVSRPRIVRKAKEKVSSLRMRRTPLSISRAAISSCRPSSFF